DFGNPDALVNSWFDADVTSLALLFCRPRASGDGRPAGATSPAGLPPYAKGPACRARGAHPSRVRGRPRGAARTQTRNATPGTALPHGTGSAASGLPARTLAGVPAGPVGRPGGRWSSAYAPARCDPAGRQARLT